MTVRSLLAGPLSSEGEFLCSDPAESCFSAGPVAPLSSPPPPPTLCHSMQIFSAALGPPRSSQVHRLTGPSTSPPCLSPGHQLDLQPNTRGAAADFSRWRSPRGAVGSRGLPRSRGTRLRLAAQAEKHQKQNQHPANETPAPPGLLPAPLQETRPATSRLASRISDPKPQSQRSWRRRGGGDVGVYFEGICPWYTRLLGLLLKLLGCAPGQPPGDPIAPWERS